MSQYIKHNLRTLLFCVILSCNSQKETSPFAGLHLDKSENQVFNNIVYGTQPEQALDIYLPANRTATTRVLFYIHGGGWCAGDKNEGLFFKDFFLQKDYALISINYRLTHNQQNNHLAEQLSDVSNAIDLVLRNSDQLSITNKKTVIMGWSAGAHLGLLYAYDPNNVGKIKGAIAVATPTDLADPVFMKALAWPGINGGNLVTWLLKDTITVNPVLWKKSSPLYAISNSAPPTFFIHGMMDDLIPPYHASGAVELLKAKNIPSSLSLVENAGHGLLINNIFEHLDKADSFIRKNVP